MPSEVAGGKKATLFRLLSWRLHVDDSHAKGAGINFQFRNLFYIFSHFREILTLFDANTPLLVLFGLCFPNFHQSQGSWGGGGRVRGGSALQFFRQKSFREYLYSTTSPGLMMIKIQPPHHHSSTNHDNHLWSIMVTSVAIGLRKSWMMGLPKLACLLLCVSVSQVLLQCNVAQLILKFSWVPHHLPPPSSPSSPKSFLIVNNLIGIYLISPAWRWNLYNKQGQIGLERSASWSLIPIHGRRGSRGMPSGSLGVKG